MSISLFSLEKKTVVITGACGLIGKALCKGVSDAGARVAVCDIDYENAVKIADDLNNNSFAVKVDVTDRDSLSKAKDYIIYKTSSIEGLVNCAAVNDTFKKNESKLEQSKFENFSIDVWEESIKVNLTGTFLSCQTFGEVMAKCKKGSIINIASTYGIVAPDQSLYRNEEGKQIFYKSPSYPTTKGGIISFTRYLAAYWGKFGIRVNTLSPGGVYDKQEEFFVKKYSEKTMLGRMSQPEEYCGAVIFLISDASSYMTGANLIIDGGWTAW
ncbi:MAG: SDR family oxidoreductase [Ignavibacteria bacterium]|nr:SDR family oxidoreductase [Ignavibacteria bacterium]